MPKLHWNLRAKPVWNLGIAILPVSRGLLLWLSGNSLTKMGSASLSYWTTPIWLCPFFWKVFFFLRGTVERALHWSTLQHPLACHFETIYAVVGPTGLSSPGEDRRRVGSARPCAEDCPPSRPGFPQTAVEHGGSILLRLQILLLKG